MLANTSVVALTASPFVIEWPRVILGVTPCRLIANEFTARRPAEPSVCVAEAETVMAGLAVRFVVIVWVPPFEIVIWFPGPMAVMVVPVGIPVPEITCPTMRPAVLVRLTILLLAITEAELKLLLGTTDVIVDPSGIPTPVIVWPAKSPVVLVTVTVLLPSVMPAEKLA